VGGVLGCLNDVCVEKVCLSKLVETVVLTSLFYKNTCAFACQKDRFNTTNFFVKKEGRPFE